MSEGDTLCQTPLEFAIATNVCGFGGGFDQLKGGGWEAIRATETICFSEVT